VWKGERKRQAFSNQHSAVSLFSEIPKRSEGSLWPQQPYGSEMLNFVLTFAPIKANKIGVDSQSMRWLR
jgi:hypothetical protein